MEREFEQLKKREEKFLLMHRAQVEMAAVRNRKELLIMIVNTAAALTGAEGAALYLIGSTNKLILKAVKKAGKTGAESIDGMIPAKTISFFDRFKEKLLDSKEIRQTTGDSPTSLTGSFLRVKEEKLGSVYSYHCNPGREFSKEDEGFLEFFSQFASAAISNTRESSDYQEPDPLESLLTISQSMLSERNLPILLEVIARNALQVLGADLVVLYEYNAYKKDVVLPPILQGNFKNRERLEVKGETHKESAIFKIINRNEPYYAPDAGKDWEILFTSVKKSEDKEDNFLNREGICSSAGIPLMINKELVGILFINYRKPCSFPPALRKKIELFSNEAAIAIGNAKIFSQKERYISELNVLNNINREISSSVTLEIKEIL
jgi:GAF domain-containing protein